MTIGEKLKKLRGEETQMSFGKRVGVSEKTVKRWESGQFCPRVDQLFEICKQKEYPVWMFFQDVE